MDETTPLAQSDDVMPNMVADPNNVEATDEEIVSDENEEIAVCMVCEETALNICRRCKGNLCETHSYIEEGGTFYYCRGCADEIVGVCAVCDALRARPCRECGMKVCEAHHKRVIERWGWGGAPGQGGFTSWFPVLYTYCQEHGQNRFDIAKPTAKVFKGYDGSSPEW